jgi:hypothetical protein
MFKRLNDFIKILMKGKSMCTQAYLELTKHCPIKVGDTVKLLRKFEAGEMGTSCKTDDVDKFDFIGDEMKVVKITEQGGYRLMCSDGKKRHYPFFVLEKVDESSKVVNMTISDIETFLKDNGEIADDQILHIVAED